MKYLLHVYLFSLWKSIVLVSLCFSLVMLILSQDFSYECNLAEYFALFNYTYVNIIYVSWFQVRHIVI